MTTLQGTSPSSQSPPPDRGPASQTNKRLLGYAGEFVVWGFLIAAAVIEFAPISWMFSTSLRDPKDSFNLPPDFWPTAFHWQNYVAVITSPDIEFLLFFWNSVKIAGLITAAQLLTCSMAAFAFARLRFPAEISCSSHFWRP